MTLRSDDPTDLDRTLFGAALGGLGTLMLAAVLVPLRDHVVNANLALALVVPVLLAAAFGGRLAGIVSAIIAAASFDFFFTRPYTRLTIDNRNDIETMIVLSIVALIVAEIGTRLRQLEQHRQATRSEFDRLHRIADLAARGVAADDLVSAVRTELVQLLDLADCAYRPASDASGPDLPRLGARGAVDGLKTLRFGHGELMLPPDGIELPVVGGGRQFGQFVLIARPGGGASIEQRLVAVVLADELGIAMAPSIAD
jgi:hypothetical protein